MYTVFNTNKHGGTNMLEINEFMIAIDGCPTYMSENTGLFYAESADGCCVNVYKAKADGVYDVGQHVYDDASGDDFMFVAQGLDDMIVDDPEMITY